MSKMPHSKIFGVRVPIKLLNDYFAAIKSFPIFFSSTLLIVSYMKYIISMSKKYEKTGHLRLGFISDKKNVILVDLDKTEMEIFDYENKDKDKKE